MKRSLLRVRNLATVALIATLSSTGHGLSDTEWKYRQGFLVEHSGVVRIAVPLDTLDHATPDLHDLRVVGANGAELPFALVRPASEPARWVTLPRSDVALQDDATVITVDGQDRKRWEGLAVVTPSPSFLTPARVEGSLDGKTWEIWREGVPLFRRDGVEKTTIDLPEKEARYFRITLNDRQQKAIVVTAVQLREPAAEHTAFEGVPLRLARTDEYATETAVTLALPAANIDLDSVNVVTPEAAFTRRVRAVLRKFQDGELSERSLASDTVFRLRLDASTPAEKTRASLPISVPSRELILYFENGDSPPLQIDRIVGTRRVVYFAFEAQAGRYQLWSGNPESPAPRYDLAAMSGSLRHVAPSTVRFDAVTENPSYRRPDPLAGLALEGSAINPSEWAIQRAVHLAQGGVHLLELDLAALSTAQPSLADLRLVRANRQVPYILEHTRLSRALELAPSVESDSKLPSLSRWRIALPRPGAPISQLELSTTAPLFQRQFRVFEKRTSSNGESFEVELGRGAWQRTPGQKQTAWVLPLERPATAQLWIETDNGDNPPLTLSRIRAYHPVTRLLFRTDAAEDLKLLSGNARVPAPRYDLGLVAPTLLASDKTPATLEPGEKGIAPAATPSRAKTALFWGTLSLVVIALLAVTAKLLPKPPE